MWEAMQSWFVDFPSVARHYQTCVSSEFPDAKVTIAFLWCVQRCVCMHLGACAIA